MESQSIENLRGEIKFREKLARQHVSGEVLLPDYYQKDEHDQILRERVNTTIRDIEALKPQLSSLSPFIELGAERCQRSLVLTNDYSATGFAVDISYHQLNAAKYFAELFNRPRLPMRVCCDVGNLPFKPEAFSLAFCYQFIHHFPTPKIVIDQINRVLGDGFFFFAEEPFQGFKVSLYRQKDSIYSKAALRKNKLIRFIERFISEEYCEEREYGILENDDIPIGVWLDALSDFKHRDIRLDSLQGRISSKLGDSVSFSNFANAVIGGSIRATCKKQAKLQLESPSVTAHETAAHETTAQETTALEALLLCPDCGMEAEDASSQTSSQTTLYRENDQLHCPNCGASFPIVNDVIILLPKALLKELYPEFAG